MNSRSILRIALLAVVFVIGTITAANAQTAPPPKDWVYWLDEKEGFGATFPGAPDRADITTADSEAHSYTFIKKERDFVGATFTVMVEMLPVELTAAQQVRYLDLKNATFVNQMAIDPAPTSSWATFGKDRKRLVYKFKYKQDGMLLTAYGFWIVDRRRVIKVGVSYTDGLTPSQVAETLTFPDSFFFLATRK